MMVEIERKFLVINDSFKNEFRNKIRITQQYLSSIPERSVRIRVKGNEAYITIKGLGDNSGISRFEW